MAYFFAHWLWEINIKRFGDNIPILPVNIELDVYRYSDAMLKHLPEKFLKTF